MQDPRDELRQKVLEYFYAIYNQTPTKVLLPDEVVQNLITYNREEVFAAIEFLTDEKYLKQKQTGHDFGYLIAPKGLNEFVISKFSPKPISSLSFNMNGGIFVNGDNLGKIKQETVQSFEEITELIKKIIESEKLSDAKKREAIGDAETIRAQMTKAHPDKSIVSKAFENLQYVGAVIEAVNVIRAIADMLHPYVK
jgi:hypothetical protein